MTRSVNSFLADILDRVIRIEFSNARLEKGLHTMAASLTEILNAVNAEKQDIADAASRIGALETQLQSALANNDPTTAQAILDSITAERQSIQGLATPTVAPPASTPS